METKVESTPYKFWTGVDQPHYSLMQKIEKNFTIEETKQGVQGLSYEKCRVLIDNRNNLIANYYNRLYKITSTNGVTGYGKVSNIIMIADGCIEVELDIDYGGMYMYIHFGVKNSIGDEDLLVSRSSYPNTKSLIQEDPRLKDYIKAHPYSKTVITEAKGRPPIVRGGAQYTNKTDFSDSTIGGSLSRSGLYAVFLMDLTEYSTRYSSKKGIFSNAVIRKIREAAHPDNGKQFGEAPFFTSGAPSLESSYVCVPVLDINLSGIVYYSDTERPWGSTPNNIRNIMSEICGLITQHPNKFQGFFYGPNINTFRRKFVLGYSGGDARELENKVDVKNDALKAFICVVIPSLYGIVKRKDDQSNGGPEGTGNPIAPEEFHQISQIDSIPLPETYNWFQPNPESEEVKNYYVASQLKGILNGTEVNLGLMSESYGSQYYPTRVLFNGKFVSFLKDPSSGVEETTNFSYQVPYATQTADKFFEGNRNTLDTGLAQAATSATLGSLLQQKTYIGDSLVNTNDNGGKTGSTLSSGFPITSMIGQTISGLFGVASNQAKRRDIKNGSKPELLATEDGIYSATITNGAITMNGVPSNITKPELINDGILKRDPELVKYVNRYVYLNGYYGFNIVKLDYSNNVSSKVCYFEISDDTLMIKLQKHIGEIHNNLPTTNAINSLYNLLNEGVRIWKTNPDY